jgi:hypothetical protein
LVTDSYTDSFDSYRNKMKLSTIYACSLYSDSLTALTAYFFKLRIGEKKIKKVVTESFKNKPVNPVKAVKAYFVPKTTVLLTARDSNQSCQNQVVAVKEVLY